MTENKRFTFTNAETTVKTPLIRDNDVPLSFCEVKDLLNALHEENIKSKKEFDSFSHNWNIMYNEAKELIKKLTKENQELKKGLKELNEICEYYEMRIKELLE